MKGHYKPEDFRREKRRRWRVSGFGWDIFGATVMVLSFSWFIWVTWPRPKPETVLPVTEPPIPSLSVEEQILGELVRGNVLLERIAKALETKPVATTNALRTPLPGVAEQLGVSAATRKLVAELQPRGDE